MLNGTSFSSLSTSSGLSPFPVLSTDLKFSILSFEYLSICICTSCSGDCLRTLEFTDLSLSLSFEQFGSAIAYTLVNLVQ